MSLAQACHIIYGSEIDKTQHLYEIIVLNFIIPGDPQKSTGCLKKNEEMFCT